MSKQVTVVVDRFAAKAFAKVRHNGLVFKLLRMALQDSLVHIIREYLSINSSVWQRNVGLHKDLESLKEFSKLLATMSEQIPTPTHSLSKRVSTLLILIRVFEALAASF